MLRGLVKSRAHQALAIVVGLVGVSATPAAAKSVTGGPQVVYNDPFAMTPQARLASQTEGKSLSNKFSSIETYPDNILPARQQSFTFDVAPQRMANLDQRDFVKIGAPYRQGGVWYVPANEPNYDETGIASWYGAGFHGKETSNGEAFDMDVISAAHPTLPLPSIVEVTNLENGRTLKVRVNDRGPFLKGRLIDLSRKGAQQLGYYGKGSAKVRVRYVGPAEADTSADPFANTKPFKPAGLQQASYRASAAVTIARAPIRQSELAAPAEPVVSQPAPAKPTVGVQKTPSGLKSLGEGRYLQIGAFSSAENANKLRAKLGVAPVEIRPANGGALYKVVMGPFADEMAMSQARATANSLGISNARIVQ